MYWVSLGRGFALVLFDSLVEFEATHLGHAELGDDALLLGDVGQALTIVAALGGGLGVLAVLGFGVGELSALFLTLVL